tara:strand:+ start:46 stop:186 length:141 start_codon:yes stop_codon:yes gene_type:complete
MVNTYNDKHKKNKKITILGSSPVMMILFYPLKLKNEVVLFEDIFND